MGGIHAGAVEECGEEEVTEVKCLWTDQKSHSLFPCVTVGDGEAKAGGGSRSHE